MANTHDITAPVAYARFAGLSYAAIFALAIYANFTILGPLIEAGDPAATAANIARDEGLFRRGVACFLAVLIFDVFVAWSLYLLMKPVSASLSLLSAIFHLVYTTAHVGVVLNLVNALRIADSPQIYASFSPEQLQALSYHFLAAHQGGFTITLIFFGVHLLVLGYLIIRSTFLPSLVGLIVAVAGAGYVIDAFAPLLFPSYAEAGLSTYVVILPALVGEGALTLWLLIRGVNRRKWLEAAAA